MEASVKLNCMCLEYLGTHIRFVLLCPVVNVSCSMRTYLMDIVILRGMMFPEASLVMICDLIYKRLQFAANWIVEQATENDPKVYLIWFERFGDC